MKYQEHCLIWSKLMCFSYYYYCIICEHKNIYIAFIGLLIYPGFHLYFSLNILKFFILRICYHDCYVESNHIDSI